MQGEVISINRKFAVLVDHETTERFFLSLKTPGLGALAVGDWVSFEPREAVFTAKHRTPPQNMLRVAWRASILPRALSDEVEFGASLSRITPHYIRETE